ncbi:hypothetical protein HU200_021415 [Digitaria exilis]|uniref:RING-type domain-containing protein n=1 Tax=Digitaria exilis TaxID=1010633 RepID=A0A835F0D4_9POAL|nr:hypothetical protein HU200_021415 [Digitaria exilis]
MGDGPGPRPHNVTIPCDDVPGDHALDNLLPREHPHGPPPGQVNESAGYAVASKLMLATAGAFAGVLLALVALHLYYTSRRRRRLRLHGASGQRRLVRSPAITGDDRDGDAPSPRGLDPAVLAAIPVVIVVDAGAGDCAVCLGELEAGEKARALPRCGHRFHVECIDAWFRGNATCPLCRADVAAPGEDGTQPEVRIDVVTGDAAGNASAPAPAMARLPSGTDLGKARQVFASARFAASF